MHAAVVELDALADAVRACAEDHRALLGLRRDLALAGVVGLVVVGRLARRFCRAGVDRLERGDDAERLAVGAHGKLVGAGQVRDLHVGEAEALSAAHVLLVEFLKRVSRKRLLDGDHVGHAGQEPWVDARLRVKLFHAHATAHRLADEEDAVRGRAAHHVVEFRALHGALRTLAVCAETRAAVFKGAKRFSERFLEGAADGHDLADRLHAGRERVVGALELLEREARHLDDAVVDGRLEARGRRLRDVVHDLVERVAHCELRRGLGNREARRLGSERGGARHARVHLDDDHAARLRVDGELHVRAAGFDADLLEDGERGRAHALVFHIGEGLSRGDGDRVAGVDAHRVEVLDGAHDDAVADAVAHDLHLVLFPALDGLLDEHLACGRKLKSLAHDEMELVHVVRDAAAGTAERERRAAHHGKAQLSDDRFGVFHGVGVAAARDLDAEFLHALVEELPVLAALDGGKVAADHFDAVLVKDAGFREGDGGVQARLAAERREKRVGAFLLYDLLDELGRDRLDVGAIGQTWVGHDGRRVGVDEDNAVAVGFEDLAGLGTRVVELACLADDDRTRSDDQDGLDVGTLRH